MTPAIISAVLLALIMLYLILIYNSLVSLRNQVKNAWSQIDVQLKRRHDLIPNLVETAKGYMRHERETLEQVTKFRGQAVNAHSLPEKAAAETALSGALGRFMLVAENYPDLKANQNFLSLQEELTSTENKIGFARQHFNDQVLLYNNKIQMFPSNLAAGLFQFSPETFFEIEDASEKAAPKVSFS